MTTDEQAQRAQSAEAAPEKPKHVPAIKVLAGLAESMYEQAFEAKERGEKNG